jgi:uncharacterized protein
VYAIDVVQFNNSTGEETMNALTWFEIPSVNFDRATAFYEGLMQVKLEKAVFNGIPNGMFPYEEPGVGGAVIQDPNTRPSADGAVIYLPFVDVASLDAALARVESLGGRVIVPKFKIDGVGSIAFVLDTEGNRVGLHNRS